MTSKTCLLFLLLCCLTNKAHAQISQDRPELCGSVESARLPDGISISTAVGQGTSELSINYPKATIRLPGVQDEIRQVCSIPGHRILVFGAAGGSYNVTIVDLAHGVVADSFYAYDPVTSPDQHWIVSRAYYPPRSQVRFSEEYLLYDLTKSREANQLVPASPQADLAGLVIYPVVKNGTPFERTALSEEQVHTFCSSSFYWSSDSRFLVFGDCLNEAFSVILLDTQSLITKTHALESSDICEQDDETTGVDAKLAGVSFQLGSDGQRSINIRLILPKEACGDRSVLLSPTDFAPAEPESHSKRHRAPSELKP